MRIHLDFFFVGFAQVPATPGGSDRQRGRGQVREHQRRGPPCQPHPGGHQERQPQAAGENQEARIGALHPDGRQADITGNDTAFFGPLLNY